ncbi:GNAT superfamily N-acetyltransferase [Pullulanibacillus pueri]|uniref:N-acetyltransferase domain-containing protein n=1 Tax=Pullulanibacillus pueri TaxID=1437324 RepID=A0A8J2ZQP7_9BACL|nr:GNAT family N-acetyltransferase [Pullulanibacillus pueri]MBM7679926.1 GNAT superfamily N-acetyltransferase [Pullulanibacillus pueri]GGH73525.1 hypothetical protein GCM10007096_00840 [Pullulanibacillus pueri]
MNKEKLDVSIKPAEADQLELLVKQFSPDNPMFQYNRFDVQSNGKGLYLIAWHHEVPVGHFLLRWSGPEDEAVTQRLNIAQSAYLEAGLIIEKYQGKGVATAIIHECERLAKQKGCNHIGLEVGLENFKARSLYEKLNYKAWEHGSFSISWECLDDKGNISIDTEVVTYMQKAL